MDFKTQANQYARENAGKYTGKNCRRFYFSSITNALHTGGFGMQFDNAPFTGVLVEQNKEMTLVKVATNKFVVIDNTIAPGITEIDINSKIQVTPYHRRRFNGTLLGSTIEHGNGFSTTPLGESTSYLPFDKKTAKTVYLRDMLTQLEKLEDENGVRTIVQMFIDAGANESNFTVNNPEEEDVYSNPPAATFGINVNGFVGSITVSYDRVSDTYSMVKLDHANTIVRSTEGLYFDDLAGAVESFIDDASWKFAKIEILSKGKLKKAA